MACINLDAIKKLEDTKNIDYYVDGVKILLNLLENVIREPENPKYRTIRLENKTIKEKLLNLNGARELLIQIGFYEHEQKLSLPNDVLIATLKKYRDVLIERLNGVQCGQSVQNESVNENRPSTSTATGLNKKSTGAIKKRRNNITPLKCYRDRITFPQTIPYQNRFLLQMEHISDEVQQYEDARLQWYGLQLIPVQRLTENALKNMRAIQKRQIALPKDESNKLNDPCFRDWLLVELTKWFKEEFFTWVNSLPCKVCGSIDKKASKMKVRDGVRVELFECCNETTEFCRFNDISQLLQTRIGRCGEFANCFTFLCRCMDYDARYVVASFDHVWTEVYSVSQRKWIHVDPSDNVIDAPLIYEHGWKRDVDYIIAYSRDDIQDVTWRYCSDYEQVRLRRGRSDFSEDMLRKTILKLRQKRQSNCSAARIKYLKKRTLCELIEMLMPKQPTEDEKKGRSSGSLDWRLSRGESERCVNTFNVLTPLPEEIKSKQFNIRYSCSKNVYERFVRDNITGAESILETKPAWDSCIHTAENVLRKEERDWKMVYLARFEDTENAKIKWTFDFNENSLRIKDIHIKCDTKCFENGVIDIRYLHKQRVLPNLECAKGMSEFSIEILMSGGKGECAWQHTQLFRQSMTSRDEYPFVVQINFF